MWLRMCTLFAGLKRLSTGPRHDWYEGFVVPVMLLGYRMPGETAYQLNLIERLRLLNRMRFTS